MRSLFFRRLSQIILLLALFCFGKYSFAQKIDSNDLFVDSQSFRLFLHNDMSNSMLLLDGKAVDTTDYHLNTLKIKDLVSIDYITDTNDIKEIANASPNSREFIFTSENLKQLFRDHLRASVEQKVYDSVVKTADFQYQMESLPAYFYKKVLKIETTRSSDIAKPGSIAFIQPPSIPEFPSGKKGWEHFLAKNTRSQVAVNNGAGRGRYIVLVSFLVTKEGKVSEVKVLSNPGYGMAEEAVRVVSKSPDWIPAKIYGKSVTYREQQRVEFAVN